MKRYLLIIPLLFLITPLITEASVLPACTATGNCGICDFLDTFINIINWLLGAVGGAALFLFGWHGFGMITSGGNSEKVTAARKGMVHTILGVIIVIAAWFLVYVITGILLSTPGSSDFQQSLFDSNRAKWYQYCTGNDDFTKCQGRGLGSPCGNGKFCYYTNNGKSLMCSKSEDIEIKNEAGEIDTIKVKNACQYWAKRPIEPKAGFLNNPYTEYDCRKKADCDPYENLGSDYCPTKGTECCQLKPQPPTQMPTTVGNIGNDDSCLYLGGQCHTNANAGGNCNLIEDQSVTGTYTAGLCLSNSDSNYLCCLPDASCITRGGQCDSGATAGDNCTIASNLAAAATYVDDNSCSSNPNSDYLCCLPSG